MEKALWAEKHIKAASILNWRHFSHLLITFIHSMATAPVEITKDQWAVLKTLFSSPDDIDLYVAGQAETPVGGGLTGPTFNCIKALQFKKLMDGDRFFFTHKDQTGSFTPTQLEEIRKRRLSDILCENTGISRMRGNVFLDASTSGETLKLCSEARAIIVDLFI